MKSMLIASFLRTIMSEDAQPIINTILLQGARVETVMTSEAFWESMNICQQDNNPIKAIDVMNCEVTFLPSGVVGFIDRKNYEVPEKLKEAMAANASAIGLAPRGGRSGIVVPGAGRPY